MTFYNGQIDIFLVFVGILSKALSLLTASATADDVAKAVVVCLIWSKAWSSGDQSVAVIQPHSAGLNTFVLGLVKAFQSLSLISSQT